MVNPWNVIYSLPIGESILDMNSLIGKRIYIKYSGRINCIHCGRETASSFMQGYCYPCFISLPQTDECILHPELCQAHNGISRNMEWSEMNCLQDHFVYLAYTPDLKVGVTRFSQVPTRWIDQGARQAIRLARTPNRYLAGLIEVFLKGHVADKTNWRKMLSGKDTEGQDIRSEKKRIIDLLPGEWSEFISRDETVTEIHYPVKEYPLKVNPVNLDKDPFIEGTLSGIKGQYLLFSGGRVLNVRKYQGYLVEMKAEE